MDELARALGEIGSIRRQIARGSEFRGYGPATLAATGVIAAAAAAAQARWVPEPARQIGVYLGIWVSAAIVSSALIAARTLARARRVHAGLADEMVRMAIEQFLPAFAAGALLTVVLARSAPGSLWMLPGLWQVIYSLGVFSSCRFLPRQVALAGTWYLATGLMCLALGDGRALSPWVMGGAYGVGQSLVGGTLFFASRDGDEE